MSRAAWVAVFSSSLVACAHAGKDGSAMGSVLEQEAVVRRVVTAVVHEVDARRWHELQALFADPVTTDYTSLFGGEVQRQPPGALVAGWRGALTPLQATQHMLGPIDVEVRGDAARARCHVRGYHWAPGAPGGPEWMVAGHYAFELSLQGGTWRITSLTLRTAYQTGNARLLQEAAALGK